MATKNNTEPIFIGINDQRIELTGVELEEFLAQREANNAERAILEAEYKAKQDARESAIKKLAEIAGLTKEELASIL
jgi:hypothetical protein